MVPLLHFSRSFFLQRRIYSPFAERAMSEGTKIDMTWVRGRGLSEDALTAFFYRLVNMKVCYHYIIHCFRKFN